MEKFDIYKEIAQRTGGDIYIGVVGPVRTGKSTFIKRFMETLVLPNIANEFAQERTRDELPQSAAGRTIMTTEPKFIPNEAIEVRVGENAAFKVRMIDCVGYIVENAMGHIEDGHPRMVNTPWFEEQVPFNQAAEIGTKKVITDHSTIGLVVTTDGSICEIPRESYVAAEERVIKELKQINKPFIIVLNCANPASGSAQALKAELEQKYSVPVVAVNCIDIDEVAIKAIIEKVLFEFPIKEIRIDLPEWVDVLDHGHWLKSSIYKTILDTANEISKIREVKGAASAISQNEYIEASTLDGVDLGTGSVLMSIKVPQRLFYRILGESTGLEISGEAELIRFVNDFAKIKKEYDKFAPAIRQVRETGYGIVAPSIEELRLEEPEIVKQGGRFGVRLRASSPSIHLIQANIETEVSPIVGSEKQSEELVHYLMSEFEEDPLKIWESNIFGKSLHELVNEGLHSKLSKMPDDARVKLQETLQQIINEGSSGLICIIL